MECLKKQTLPTFAMLSAVPFVMVLSNSMLIPVLPRMQAEMDLTLFEVGLIITAFSIPAGLVLPLAGCLSDHWGRKAIMVPALFLFGLGGLIAGVCPLILEDPYAAIMAARVVQGIGAGGTYQLSMAITGDIFQSSERSKALGLLESANGLGKVVSPILGSTAALITWYSPFYVYPALAWPVAAGVRFFVKEPAGNKKRESLRGFLASFGTVFRAKAVPLCAVLLAGFTVLFLMFGSLAYLSDILEKSWRVKGVLKGVAISGPVLATTVAAYASGSLIQCSVGKRIKPASVLGLGFLTASLVSISYFSSVYVVYASLVGFGVGAGLVLPALNMLVTSMAKQSRGTLTCLYGTVRFFGAALGPPALGLGLQAGRPLTFLAGAGLALTSGLSLLLVSPGGMIPEGMEGQVREDPGEPP